MKRPTVSILCAALLALTLSVGAEPAPQAAPAKAAFTEADINAALQAAYVKFKDLQEGKNADYIPALAKVNPKIFGIALVTIDG